MSETSPLSRRTFVSTTSAATVAAVAASMQERFALAEEAAAKAGVAGKINHSACKWCYKDISLDDLCTAGKEFGLEAIDLLDPADFPTMKKHGMHCPMVSFPSAEVEIGGVKKKVGSIPHAFNRLEHHDTLFALYEKLIAESAAAGFTNVICFSGNRDGMDDEQGLENCAVGLKRLMPLCEKHGVTLTMELLNSKVNHKDYMCDLSSWGAALCDKVGSEHFKLLYDIYHMQIMEGDLWNHIERNLDVIGHFHAAGVPGRHEPQTGEVNYPYLLMRLRQNGYTGVFGLEYAPSCEPSHSVRTTLDYLAPWLT